MSSSVQFQEWVCAPCSAAPSSMVFTAHAVLPDFRGLAVYPMTFNVFSMGKLHRGRLVALALAPCQPSHRY
jgi:hypothetical protein